MPTPKYDEAQDMYYTYTAGGFTVTPITVRDIDRTGAIIEALYSASHRYMVDAYIDAYVESKILRDEESQRMFRMTLQNGGYEITSAIDPSNGLLQHYHIFWDLIEAHETTLSSAWAEIENSVNSSLKSLNEQVIEAHQ